jgi:hypothetical protein
MRYFLVLFSIFLMSSVDAQINFRVAYDPTFFKATKINSVFDEYNQNNDLAYKKYKPIRLMQGIELGGRYSFEYFNVEFAWTNRFNARTQSTWNDVNKTDRKSQSVNLAMQTYSLGSSVVLGNFSFGATVDRNIFTVTRKALGQSTKSNIYGKSLKFNSATFFLQWEGEMNQVLHFAFRPYYQMPLQSAVSILPFQKAINSNSKLDFSNDEQQDMTLMGLKLIFYNGAQRDK